MSPLKRLVLNSEGSICICPNCTLERCNRMGSGPETEMTTQPMSMWQHRAFIGSAPLYNRRSVLCPAQPGTTALCRHAVSQSCTARWGRGGCHYTLYLDCPFLLAASLGIVSSRSTGSLQILSVCWDSPAPRAAAPHGHSASAGRGPASPGGWGRCSSEGRGLPPAPALRSG